MAAWDVDSAGSADFRLVMNGFVSLYWRPSVLDDTVEMLRSSGYRVVEFDASGWSSDAAMHRDVSVRLGFPDHFGCNLDALNDCLSDVASGEYGWDSTTDTGLVVVLRSYHAFAASDRRAAQSMLDIIADQARYAMLLGHRIICLVQSADPELTFDQVGGTPVMWNDAEWLDSARGL